MRSQTETAKRRIAQTKLHRAPSRAPRRAAPADDPRRRVRGPQSCLDVLAQQVVAMTAMEPWDVAALYALVRRAYPYRDLTPAAFESVLEMVSGRFVGARSGERGAGSEERRVESEERTGG